MPILNLNHYGTKAALRHEALQGLPKLGRGWFCVVFDKGDTVLKLTADRVQYGFYTDFTAPQGDHYPRLIHNYGDIGEQNDYSLYLVEMEKLTKFGKRAEVADKAWCDRRDLLKIAEEWRTSLCNRFQHIKAPPSYYQQLSAAVLYEMSCDERLSSEMQACCQDLWRFCTDYGSSMDFQRANFMLRGETMVFNDVMADIESICAHNSRRPCFVIH